MNKKYTLFDKSTGQVFCGGDTSIPEDLETDTCGVLIGQAFTSGYITNGVHFDLPQRPSEYSIFDYCTKQWVDPRTKETQWRLVRSERDRRLQASDWTQLPDAPIATKDAWAVYRQALRDITEQPDPFNIVWPVPPQ
jgi:hypothetical protein